MSLFRSLSVLALTLALAIPSVAQVRLQVIHNAADPGAAVVDVYVNGALTLDDFAFRTATPFLDLASDTDLVVAVAPGTSTSDADAIFSNTYNLPAGAYQLIANGVLDPAQFAANPDGVSTAFTLLAATNAQEASGDGDAVAVRVVHGATDAPSIDVLAGGALLVDDVSYTRITDYFALPAADATLDVVFADGGTESYAAPLAGAEGAAVTILASGFLGPEANQNGATLRLLAVFADGTTAVLERVGGTARLQVIHNAADPAAAVVDVYVNGALLLDDLAFRTATAFIDVASQTPLTVSVAPGTSTSSADAVFTQTYTLASDTRTQLIANGVLDPAQFAANPDGVATAFTLLVGADAQEASGDDDGLAVRVVHGATDAPTVDVRSAGSVLVDDAAYTAITGYLAIPAAAYVLDVTTAGGTPVASFNAGLAGAGGSAVTVLASGFLTPADDQNGEAFGLLAVFADGTTALLGAAPISTDQAPEAGTLALGAPAPNPAATRTGVEFSLDAPGRATLALYDALGRQIATLADGDFPADRVQAALDTRGLASGVYTLRLSTASGVRSRMLTVVR